MSEMCLFCRKEILCADGRAAQLSYYRTKDESCFGILVQLKKGDTLEQEKVSSLTFSLQIIDMLLELLARNSVTPCTLKEILPELRNKF